MTKRQQEVLSEMRAGAIAYYMPYLGSHRPDPYWFLSTSYKRCTKQVEKLIELGLVEISEHGLSGYRAVAKSKI